jgi:hypothetical protein
MCNCDHNNLMERDPPSGSVQLIGCGHLATRFWQNADKMQVTNELQRCQRNQQERLEVMIYNGQLT